MMAALRSPRASAVRPSQYSPSAMLLELVAAERSATMQRGVGLVQETQRNPAGEKLGFDIGIARDEAVLVGDLIGNARLAGVERSAAVHATLDPPVVEVEQDVRLTRRIEQHLPSFFVAVLAAEVLDAIEAQADIGLDRARRQRVEQLAGIATPLDHSDAGGHLLLLVGRKQLGHAKRGGGCRFVVGIKQPVDALPVVLDGQHVAEAIEDLGLDRSVELVIAPSRDHEVARASLVALFEIDAGE